MTLRGVRGGPARVRDERGARTQSWRELSLPAGLQRARHRPVRDLARRLQRGAAAHRHRSRDHREESRRATVTSSRPTTSKHVSISAVGAPLASVSRATAFLDVRGGFALLSFDLDGLDRVPERLTFDYSVLFDEEPRHRGFLLVEHNWATGTFANEGQISLVFSPNRRVRSSTSPRAAVCAAFWPSCGSASSTSGWASIT